MFAKRPQASASVGECRASSGAANRRETQNCRHFWTRLASSRLKSVNSHRDRGGVDAKRRTVVTFGLVSGLRVSKVPTQSQGSGGSWSRNAELSSLLDSSRVSASQKCQQSQGSGGSWSRNAEMSSLLDSSCVFAFQKCQHSHRDRGGRGRETQNCRHFWTRLVSSRLKSVNSHRDRGGSWSRNAELSSLLDSSRLFASQKCQHAQRSGGVWSRNA